MIFPGAGGRPLNKGVSNVRALQDNLPGIISLKQGRKVLKCFQKPNIIQLALEQVFSCSSRKQQGLEL